MQTPSFQANPFKKYFISRNLLLPERGYGLLKITPIFIKKPFVMKLKVFRWCVFFWAIFVGNVALCHAFSFGEIRLLSQFGGPFLAEVELFHEVGGVVEIEIGSREDYQRLQFERPAILDELEIVEIRRLTANSVLAQIASSSALFYPSFHLILKASHNGGTLLESYLIAVDFQSSLSLGGSSSENDLSLKKPDKKESTAVLSTKGVEEEKNIPVPVLSAEVSPNEEKIVKASEKKKIEV